MIGVKRNSRSLSVVVSGTFHSKIILIVRFGRTHFEQIATLIKTKDKEQVSRYSQAFFERLHLL